MEQNNNMEEGQKELGNLHLSPDDPEINRAKTEEANKVSSLLFDIEISGFAALLGISETEEMQGLRSAAQHQLRVNPDLPLVKNEAYMSYRGLLDELVKPNKGDAYAKAQIAEQMLCALLCYNAGRAAYKKYLSDGLDIAYYEGMGNPEFEAIEDTINKELCSKFR